MKRFSLFIFIISILISTSCKKEEIPTYVNQNGITTELYTTGSSTKQILSFSSPEAYHQKLQDLISAVDLHDDNFVNMYGDYTDSQLDSIEEVLAFDTYQPLVEFENALGFTSLRQLFLVDEEIWLDNGADTNTTLFDDYYNLTEEEMALVNEDGAMMIAGVYYVFRNDGLHSFNDQGDFESFIQDNSATDIIDVYKTSSGDCKSYAKEDDWQYNSGFKMYRRIQFRWYPWASVSKVCMKTYKKNWRGKWRKSRTSKYIGFDVVLYEYTCTANMHSAFVSKSKKRKTLSKTHTKWDTAIRKVKNGQSILAQLNSDNWYTYKLLTW